MKRALLCVFAISMAMGLKAQQDPQFTQWMYDKLSFNPAIAGTDGANCLNLFYRQQWSGFTGNPESILFNYHAPVKAVKGGLGLTFVSDKLGQETNTMIRLAYAYHQPIGTNKLSIGIGLGYYQKRLGSDWLPPDGVESIPNDEAIQATDQSAGAFDLNFGAYFYKPDTYYIGLSGTHLTGQDLTDLSIDVATHLYFMAGYVYPVNNKVKIRPNLLMKTDMNEAIFDVNVNALINDMFWAGLSYRTEDAIAPMLGGQYSWDNEDGTMPQSIRIGYSYDLTTSDIKNYSSGSHEIMLTYCFNLIDKVVMKKYGNPRFL